MKIAKIIDELDVSGSNVVIGRHSIWLPQEQVKIPFQWGGRVQKYRHVHESSYSRESVAEEYTMMKWLASQKAAPPVGDLVFVKTLISQHLGAWWADPVGAYGYEIADVSTLTRPGAFDLARIKAKGKIRGSEGAWNDLLVLERGNVVNGYVIDLRRSWFDNLRWEGHVTSLPESVDRTLVDDLNRDGQFPFRERSAPYQEYYLDGRWWSAERDVVTRAGVLGFNPQDGETVVDLGCCTGGFLQYAKLSRAGLCLGLDAQAEFIDLARRLARANQFNICYRQVDLVADILSPVPEMLSWVRQVLPSGPDHLLVLSMGKHLRDDVMWAWIDAVKAKHTYLETNAIKPDAARETWHYWDAVHQRNGQFVGFTLDRNTRACYRIDRDDSN